MPVVKPAAPGRFPAHGCRLKIKGRDERWAVPGGNVSGGRNRGRRQASARVPTRQAGPQASSHGDLVLDNAVHGASPMAMSAPPFESAVSRKVSGKSRPGRLDHGINALVNLSWIRL